MSKDVRVIGIFTGNRAEYGLQFPVLKAIDNHPNLDYKLIVSGAHLEKDFGQTIEEIRASVLAAPVVRCDEVSWAFLQISMAGWNAIASMLLTFTTGFTIISLRYEKR